MTDSFISHEMVKKEIKNSRVYIYGMEEGEYEKKKKERKFCKFDLRL